MPIACSTSGMRSGRALRTLVFHGMVGGDAVDCQPADAAIEHPLAKPRLRPRVLRKQRGRSGSCMCEPAIFDTVHLAALFQSSL